MLACGCDSLKIYIISSVLVAEESFFIMEHHMPDDRRQNHLQCKQHDPTSTTAPKADTRERWNESFLSPVCCRHQSLRFPVPNFIPHRLSLFPRRNVKNRAAAVIGNSPSLLAALGWRSGSTLATGAIYNNLAVPESSFFKVYGMKTCLLPARK